MVSVALLAVGLLRLLAAVPVSVPLVAGVTVAVPP
jgi:hypothetical protein